MITTLILFRLDDELSGPLQRWFQQTLPPEVVITDSLLDYTAGTSAVAYAPVLMTMANAMANGVSLAAAQARCRDDAQDLLIHLRRNRGALTLLELDGLTWAPTETLSALGVVADGNVPPLEIAPNVDPIWTLFAAEALKRDRSLGRIASELAASSMIRGNAGNFADLIGMSTRYRHLVADVSSLNGQVAQGEEARRNLEATLSEVRDESSELLSRYVELQTALSAREADVQQDAAEREELRRSLKEARAELAQINASQDEARLAKEAELAASGMAQVQMRAELEASERRASEGHEERDEILGELLRTQEMLAERLVDLDRIEARRFQMQEGIEALNAQVHRLEGDLARKTGDVSRLTNELQMLSAVVQQRNREIADARNAIDNARAEIDGVLSSRSYKITSPLRWARRMLSRAL